MHTATVLWPSHGKGVCLWGLGSRRLQGNRDVEPPLVCTLAKPRFIMTTGFTLTSFDTGRTGWDAERPPLGFGILS